MPQITATATHSSRLPQFNKMTPLWYVNAVKKPLEDHSTPGTVEQKNTIVLHITAGSSEEGAYQTFKNSKSPNRVSAHFCIDQAGTIFQYLPISDIAWHASQCNTHSIGIEHVAIPGTLMATEEQYAASAMLVSWLCCELSIPADRSHVRTHNEASPRDGHVQCCTGALDPDRVVQLAAQIGIISQ